MKKPERVYVKVLENSDNPALKEKYIGAVEFLRPGIGSDGKLITGFDENSVDILALSGDEKQRAQKEIKKEREDIEKILQVNLGPHSSYWDDFLIVLADEDLELNLANPKHQIILKVGIANRWFAPSKEDIVDDERYVNCRFYVYREQQETAIKAAKLQKEGEANAKLYQLRENPNKLKIVAAYLFHYDPEDLDVDDSFVKLNDYITEPDPRKKKSNISLFLETANKTPEALQVKLILDKAYKNKLVTKINTSYRIGEIIIGDSYEEALEYLSLPSNSGEFVSLKKQLAKIDKG